jgi:hypothetical protein
MAYSAYRPLDHGEAARLEAFVADHRSSVLGFFARIGRARPAEGARGLLDAGRAPGAADHDAAVHAAARITGSEKAWLDAHVDADHQRDAYEEALLAFVAEEGSPS